VPTPYPKEFRRDVIAVARQGDQSIAQVARNFGISESCLNRWLRIADRDEGLSAASAGRLLMIRRSVSCAGATSSSSRRSRSCVARRPTSLGTPSQNDVPAGP
jgi:transposase-like protein